MSEAKSSEQSPEGVVEGPLARLRSQILSRWTEFPAAHRGELDALLTDALGRAGAAEPEILTVMDPAARPQRLRLASVVDDVDLDSFYHNEWAELAISHDGRCFLVYRRRDGGDYAVTWSPATTVPSPLMRALPEVLAMALLESDGEVG
jgi:hypothetical protein